MGEEPLFFTWIYGRTVLVLLLLSAHLYSTVKSPSGGVDGVGVGVGGTLFVGVLVGVGMMLAVGELVGVGIILVVGVFVGVEIILAVTVGVGFIDAVGVGTDASGSSPKTKAPLS
jgi:hypothetical protein